MTRRLILASFSVALLAGCSMAPHYVRPSVTMPQTFKAAPGWHQAVPSDGVAKGAWWTLFNDPRLDALEARVIVSNQNLAASAAAYRQATQAVRETRSSLFPSVTLNGSGTKTGSFGKGTPSAISIGGTGGSVSGSLSDLTADSRVSLSLGASWQPDLWGRVGNAVSQAKAQAEASEADLLNATLAAQGELASDYVQLRGLDRQKVLLDDTVNAYAKALVITQNRYRAGVAVQSDVLQAEVQLRNARAQALDLGRTRATYEDAIAVLVGANPSSFTIAPRLDWTPTIPEVPSVLPGEIVQRRPDVAATERQVAAANAAIGIQKAAFFPTIGLSGSAGSAGSGFGDLFNAASSFWSLGASLAETVFDFGGRSAKVKEARAAYDQAVATYRQTVLTAFQQTEDGLAAVRILSAVDTEQQQAATASLGAQRIALNQYLAGQIDYTSVVTTQTAALSAQQAAVQSSTNRQVAAVSLIEAVGGTW